MKLTRGEWAIAVAAVGVAAGCVRLGIWQLDRLAQRRERNARVAAARALPPLELPGAAASLPLDSLRDRRLTARGVFDFSRETVWPGRSYDGIPGADLVTPLRLADGSAVLVDRGWAPSPDGFHLERAAYAEADSAVVEGLGAVAPRGRADVDLRRFQDSVPYPLLPFVLQRTDSSAWSGDPRARLRRWPPPPVEPGPHLSYAVQWFSFATIALVGTALLLRKARVARGGAI